MKKKKGILALFALAGIALLAACSNGGSESTTTSTTNPSTEPSDPFDPFAPEESTTAPAGTYVAYTLEELHTARVNRQLLSLDRKNISIKGKVTYAKRVNENNHSIIIQKGKYALRVTYPEPFSVNVGDSVEVKGQLAAYEIYGVPTIVLYTDREILSNTDIRVIDEAITTETVDILKESDLLEYDCSLAHIDFTVTGKERSAALFEGKLPQGDTEFIVTNVTGIAEKFTDKPYEIGDSVSYTGPFAYAGITDAKIIRYFLKEGFAQKNN